MAISNQQKNRATKKLNVTPQPLKIRGGAPSGNVSKSEILQRMLENNALRLVSEEIVDKTGTPVTGVTSVTWATFTGGSFDLTTARYVHVSDKHSTRNATATPGSLWRIDPTGGTGYKRQLADDPIYCATLASAPDPTAYPGLECYVASFDGDVVSNGTAYEPKDQYVVLKNLSAYLERTTSLETEWYPISLGIPRDVNGKSLLRQNGYIQFHSIWWNKVGTTDNLRAIVRMGTNNSASDLAIIDASNTPVTRWVRDVELKRTGDTTIQFRGDGSTTFNSGGSAATHSTDLTINNMDTTPTYINVGGRLTKTGGSLVDTALYIKECEIRLFKAGPA